MIQLQLVDFEIIRAVYLLHYAQVLPKSWPKFCLSSLQSPTSDWLTRAVARFFPFNPPLLKFSNLSSHLTSCDIAALLFLIAFTGGSPNQHREQHRKHHPIGATTTTLPGHAARYEICQKSLRPVLPLHVVATTSFLRRIPPVLSAALWVGQQRSKTLVSLLVWLVFSGPWHSSSFFFFASSCSVFLVCSTANLRVNTKSCGETEWRMKHSFCAKKLQKWFKI